MSIWEKNSVVENYLSSTRRAIPFAVEQLELIDHLISHNYLPMRRFLDLGAGDGVITQFLQDRYPNSEAILVDCSSPMLEAAKQRLQHHNKNWEAILADLSSKDWLENLPVGKYFDAVISGFCIHHLPHGRKYELYQEIFERLVPGGVFLNLEHVASSGNWGKEVFDQLFVEALIYFEQTQENPRSPEAVWSAYEKREDKEENILLNVDIQCQWLRLIGFEQVDVFFKWFELALFGGVKPLSRET